jgi:hypothetical protein
MHRFVPVLAQKCGARVLQVPVQHHPRVAGQTKYTLSRSVRVLLDLITVKFLHTYLTRPMHVMGLAGLVAMALGFLSLGVPIWNKVFYNISIIRSPMLHLSMMLEMIGVQLISLGLLGEVLSRTYFESQGKRVYMVRNTLNLEQQAQRKAA